MPPQKLQTTLANFQNVLKNIKRAIVDSNCTRKHFIADQMLAMQPKVVGAFRLTMQSGSDNLRQSSALDIIRLLKSKGMKVIIYKPTADKVILFG